MAGPSRIDELRKKFDENPRRYFAPLANEYRKIGDFEQAIFICQEFLPQQPGHMSGHIVYGQALFESGRHDEARSVFETALALDPENLIALRHLGDIARAHGDNETARAWYRRVLESDPRNEEISAILASIETDGPPAQPSVPQAGSSPPDGQSSSLTIESAISSASPGTDSHTTAAAPDPIVDEPLTSAPAESSFDDIARLFTTAAPTSGSSPSGPLQLIHEGEDLLGHPDEHTSEDAKPIRAGGGQAGAGATSGGSQFSSPDDGSPAGFQMPFLEGLTSADASAPPPPPAPAVQAPAQPAPAQPPAPAADASTAFVTETMAELYVQQGHLEQALDVYRQLVQLHPNDSALAARLRKLEEGRAQALHGVPAVPAPQPVAADVGPTIREFLGLIADFRPRTGRAADDEASPPPRESPPAAPPEPRQGAASSTSSVGGSIHNLFTEAERPPSDRAASSNNGAMAPSPPPPRAEPEPAPIRGRPSTPAATELSLDHVFRHATPATGTGSQSGFSFDQFFSQQAQQDVKATDAEPSVEASPGQADDIQQFNAWLEGLKKT
jgi:tetratricopeptide (TPR) repeat protein